VDASGNAHVCGETRSTDFPTANAYQSANGGGGWEDAFVAKLNAAGSALVYSTYLGGSDTDSGRGIAVDPSGNAYVTGNTRSTDFPTASPFQTATGGTFDAFVAKLNAAGSALVYSTYLGGSGDDRGSRIALDASGNAYVVGITNSTNFPTVNPLQAANAGDRDAFVAKFNATGSNLLSSTYFGGSGSDYGMGIALDGSGNVYVIGGTSSSDFPTANPRQPANGGLDDVFVAKIANGTPPPGDFNADGRADILWRNQTTGDNAVWFMNGTTFTGSVLLPRAADTNWQIVGAAPFNGDVRTDILWRNRATGENAVWFMNGPGLLGGSFLTTVGDLNWRIAATADFDADGKPDILWRNQASGDNVVWFMNGTTIKGGAVLTPVADPSWRIVGAADFDADGKPDILWRNQSTGDNLVWFMDGTSIKGGAILTPVRDVNWAVGAIGDYNGDGKPDIVWHHEVTGDTLVWLIDNTQIIGGVVLAQVDTHWTVVGPR
jgi:hypothetical protein